MATFFFFTVGGKDFILGDQRSSNKQEELISQKCVLKLHPSFKDAINTENGSVTHSAQ